MSQLTGPVGLGPIDPYYYSGEYEKEEEKKRAAEQLELEQKTKEDATPKTSNPIQGLLDLGDGAVGRGIKSTLDVVVNPVTAVTEKIGEATGNQAMVETSKEVRRVSQEAIIGSLTSVVDTADLLGDVAKVGVKKVFGQKIDPTQDPWSDRYTAAVTSFGLEKPKTQIGQFAAKLAQFALITKAAATMAPKALIGLGTKGVGLKGAVASGIVPGAVADFMLTTAEDGNLSQMVQNLVPKDSPLYDAFFLATKDGDGLALKKVKSVLEGGMFGAVADGLMWMTFGRNATQAAKVAGDSDEVALAKGLEASKTAMKEVDAKHAKNVKAESARWSEAHQAETEELLELERSLMEREEVFKASKVPDNDPEYVALKETLDDVRLNQAELDERIVNGYDPDDARSYQPQDAAATIDEGNVAEVIADQYEVYGKGINVANRGYGQGPIRGAAHMMTDAQYKVQGIKGRPEEIIRSLSSREELQGMAERAKVPMDNVVRSAADDLEDFRNALGDQNINQETFYNMMKQRQIVDPENITGQILSDKGILVTKALIRDAGVQIHNLALNAASNREAGQPVGNAIDRLTDRVVFLLGMHKYTAYKTGFKLQTLGSAIGLDRETAAQAAANFELTRERIKKWGMEIKSLQRSNDPRAADELDALIKGMVLSNGDPTKVVKFHHAARELGFKQAIQGMYHSILSGPITHLRNGFGNTYSLLERPFSTYLRGTIGGDKSLRASAVAGLHGMATGIQDSWKVAMTTLKSGESVNFDHKFVIEDFQTQATLENMHLAARTNGEKLAASFLENSYKALNNPWISWPGRALMASDDFFKALSARYRIYSKSMYDAMAHSADDADVDMLFNKYVSNFSKGIDPQTGRINDPDLLNYAERITFQQEPGSFINSISNMVDNSGGIGKLFLPFIRTPANLMGYGLEHIPGIHKAIKGLGDTLEAAKKNKDFLLVAEIEGRQATGAMLTMAMLTTALSTDVTGNWPHDANERAAWKEEGRPPFSIKVGNVWISYASLEPVNSMLSIVADAVRLAKIGGADAAGQITRQLWYSVTAAYTDKSFLAGLTEIADLIDPKNLSDPSGARFAWNTFNSLAPYSGARRGLSNALNPFLKETRDELDRMLIQASPGFGEDVPSITSWLTGKKQLSNAGGLYNAVSPIRIHEATNNIVVKTMTDIGFPSNTIIKTGLNGVKLQPEAREQLAKILFKSGLPKRLKSLFEDKAWQNMAKQYKGRSITTEMILGEKDDAPPHIKEVRTIVSKYKKQALRELYETNAEYRAQVFQRRDEQIRAYKGDFTQAKAEQFLEYANAKPTNTTGDRQ
jgi:hypothetical protein